MKINLKKDKMKTIKDFLIRHFALSYEAKIFGTLFKGPRAIGPSITSFALAVIYTGFFEPLNALEYFIWLPFALCILLGFTIIKNKYVNYAVIVMFIIVTIFESFWMALPLTFYIVGMFMKKTDYLFYTVKYDELRDWEQKYQYLKKPDSLGRGDETFPSGIVYKNELKKYSDYHNFQFEGSERFVKPMRIIYPFAVIIALGIIYSISQ